jgi:hypothetical protein
MYSRRIELCLASMVYSFDLVQDSGQTTGSLTAGLGCLNPEHGTTVVCVQGHLGDPRCGPVWGLHEV